MIKKIAVVMMICLSFFVKAQNIDLYNLVSGKIENFKNINDYKTNELIGYFILSRLDKISNDYNKYEYTFLDKNLNKIVSKEFQSESTIGNYRIEVNYKNEVVLNARCDLADNNIIGTNKIINLKTNQITTNYDDFAFFRENAFYDCPKNYKEFREKENESKKRIGFTQFNQKAVTNDGLTIIKQTAWKEKYKEKDAIICFDKNKIEKWRYEYNKSIKDNGVSIICFIESDDQYLYLIKENTYKNNKTYSILFVEKNNGTIKEVLIENQDKDYSLQLDLNDLLGINFKPLYKKSFDDKIVIVDKLFNKLTRYVGYFKLEINKVEKNIKVKKISFIEDFKEYIPKINYNGYVENNYYLSLRDIIFPNSEELKFIFEKHKPEGYYNSAKTTDLVYISTDSNFKINNFKNIDKEKSINNDTEYLFSQVYKNGSITFFYYDYIKENNVWNLYINQIVNNEVKQEVIVVKPENKKMTIYPYFAKEGYILLYEHNEKDKYNQIRLEKLNY